MLTGGEVEGEFLFEREENYTSLVGDFETSSSWLLDGW